MKTAEVTTGETVWFDVRQGWPDGDDTIVKIIGTDVSATLTVGFVFCIGSV
jgi:hypothetical protein